MIALAPAKLNLCLYLGGRREDGLHELCSLFTPISLADRLRIEEREEGADEVDAPGVLGPDLTARALAALREAGWRRPPLRIEVDKRIPIAAGLGGGSADAAAILRLAAGEIEPETLARIAAGLGADVPSQLDPRLCLVGGAGELVTPLPDPDPFWAVLVPDPDGLSTADVFAEADRLGIGREAGDLERLRSVLIGATAAGASPLAFPELLVNDLGAAAISLRPAIGSALERLRGAGAAVALVTGSGPTAFGLFGERDAAEAAAAELGGEPQAIAAASGMIG